MPFVRVFQYVASTNVAITVQQINVTKSARVDSFKAYVGVEWTTPCHFDAWEDISPCLHILRRIDPHFTNLPCR